MKGQTIIIDLLQCSREKLADTELLLIMLHEVTEMIGLTIIEEPRIIPWLMPEARSEDDEGYTGDVIFAESHLHFHSWLAERKIWIDITACGEVDSTEIMAYLQDAFGARGASCYVKERS